MRARTYLYSMTASPSSTVCLPLAMAVLAGDRRPVNPPSVVVGSPRVTSLVLRARRASYRASPSPAPPRPQRRAPRSCCNLDAIREEVTAQENWTRDAPARVGATSSEEARVRTGAEPYFQLIVRAAAKVTNELLAIKSGEQVVVVVDYAER